MNNHPQIYKFCLQLILISIDSLSMQPIDIEL